MPNQAVADALGTVAFVLGPAEPVAVDRLRPGRSPRRDGIDATHARMLAESGAELPPIIVHRDTMRVIDGMHRLRAGMLRGADTIAVRFYDGSEHDAFVLAVGANLTHGLPLSLADRSAAAERIVGSHPRWSDRAIASATGLTAKSVAVIRSRSADADSLEVRLGRDGRMRPLNCAEGRRTAGEFLLTNPNASLREVARVAGISIGTARDVRSRIKRGENPVLPRRGQARRSHDRSGPTVSVRAAPDRSSTVLSPATAALVATLSNDPSIRYASAGKVLLRLLKLHVVSTKDSSGLGNAVPLHCAPHMAVAARECAQMWLDLADQLDMRMAAAGR